MNIRYTLIISTVVLAGAANAQLIKNGNFENLPHALTQSANGGNWDYFTNTIPGWYSDNHVLHNHPKADIEIGQAEVYGVTGISPTDNVLELDSNENSEISQHVHGLHKHDLYTISFLYADRANTSPETNDFDVLWDNKVIHAFDFTASDFSTELQGYSFTIDSDSRHGGKLSFLATGTSDSYGGIITDVHMCPAVPEPAPFAALGVGLMGLIRCRRRSKA